MAKHRKDEWKYEAVFEETMTEAEANELAQLFAEMIYEHMVLTKDSKQKDSHTDQ